MQNNQKDRKLQREEKAIEIQNQLQRHQKMTTDTKQPQRDIKQPQRCKMTPKRGGVLLSTLLGSKYS